MPPLQAPNIPIIEQVSVGMPLEPNYGEKVRIGLIALCDDIAVERDFARMVPDDRVAVVTSRIYLEQPNSVRTFADMANRIPDTIRLLMPLSRLDVIVFGCTSASAVIGPDRVEEIVQSARPGVKVTNPGTATAAALRALGARKISIITPYTVENTRKVVTMLGGWGFHPTQVSCFGCDTDIGIGSVPAAAYLELAKSVRHDEADSIFVSCTATKALDKIEAIEAATGLPCVTSNQAAFWHSMRLSGWNEPIGGFGRLMRECWP